MTSPKDLQSLSRDELLSLIDQQQCQIAELTATVATLRAEVQHLTRTGARPAAPFSRGTRLTHPKRPGRKPGSGTFRYRTPPDPAAITAPPIDVPVTATVCPDCGSPLVPLRVDSAYLTELPAVLRPRVSHYRVSVCQCTVCG